jgi:hypothetical protein
MSESSAYFGLKPRSVSKLKTVDFVQLRGYFEGRQSLMASPDEIATQKGREVYVCIDQKLLKFYMNPVNGALRYSSQIVIKCAKEGYSDVHKFEKKLYLVLNPSFNPKTKVKCILIKYFFNTTMAGIKSNIRETMLIKINTYQIRRNSTFWYGIWKTRNLNLKFDLDKKS